PLEVEDSRQLVERGVQRRHRLSEPERTERLPRRREFQVAKSGRARRSQPAGALEDLSRRVRDGPIVAGDREILKRRGIEERFQDRDTLDERLLQEARL